MRTERIIKSASPQHLTASASFAEAVFTQAEGQASGKLVKDLICEIRNGQFYLPELDLVMVDENGEIIGYAMFSRFRLDGKFENELLLLSPVAVKTELQRQHISKELIEYGFEQAQKMGYKAVLVEGGPQNYRARGFATSCHYGIVAGPNVHLPSPDCLMVKELEPGTLEHIKGTVDYSLYRCLT